MPNARTRLNQQSYVKVDVKWLPLKEDWIKGNNDGSVLYNNN